jgi:hypothetical protein
MKIYSAGLELLHAYGEQMHVSDMPGNLRCPKYGGFCIKMMGKILIQVCQHGMRVKSWLCYLILCFFYCLQLNGMVVSSVHVFLSYSTL